MNMREVDIEDLNRKFDDVLAREFAKPTLDDVLRLKPLVEDILAHDKPLDDKCLQALKRKYKYSGKRSFLFQVYLELRKTETVSNVNEKALRKTLQIKPCKSWSGIVTITIFTGPFPSYVDSETGERKTQEFSCAFNCSYCPKEPLMPRSYLKGEPAVLRATRNDFDCARQIWDRMNALYMTGHSPLKLEIIVSGGTWTSYPREYREEFCRDIYYAANVFWNDIESGRRGRLTLAEEKIMNKDATSRIVGLTVETRPDTIVPEEIIFMRRLGVTRVQLGIQHIDDDILNRVNRKCSTKRTKEAIQLLKESCFKMSSHWMLNLPGATAEADRKMLNDVLLGARVQREIKFEKRSWKAYFAGEEKQIKEIWEYYDLREPALSTDSWKIYPTAITPWTEIEKWYKEGTYVPYEEQKMKDMLMDTLSLMFPFIRLERLIRDIPEVYMYNENIGSDNTNMRQELEEAMRLEDRFCMDIRNREVKDKSWKGDYILVIRKYKASEGDEYFVSAESEDLKTLYGFVRLRLDCGVGKIVEELNGCALIREVHVYGDQTRVGGDGEHVQHRGIGRALMARAEGLAVEKKYKKAAVIAAEGNKRYYEKLGYVEADYFMIKNF